jgi:4-amino-4-deoxy-L-arabinose transferase-like glycosyltransferase
VEQTVALPVSRRHRLAPWLPLLALILVNLAVAATIVRDYGTSWDEAPIYEYGAHSLNNYARVASGLEPEDFQKAKLDFYGPAGFMQSALFAGLVRNLGFPWSEGESWHFSYFLTFQIAIVSLYLLCRRWMGAWAAFGATLLFSTQPLLWGHAFINPKDMPFMAFFLASVASGFAMVDRVSRDMPARSSYTSNGPANAGRLETRNINRSALPVVLLAGILLGITTSIRVLGPLAGFLVAGFAYHRVRQQVLGMLVPYFLVAILASYLSWPFLWLHPLGNLVRSLSIMSDFPWNSVVLFEGRFHAPMWLPIHYLPKLMGLQLTEPVLLLSVFGLCIAVFNAARKRAPEPLLLFTLWFLIPVTILVVRRTPMYDNFRQTLFLLPPVFVLAGLGLDWLFARMKNDYLHVAVIALVVLPGVRSLVALHPYQYIYYNSFQPGIHGVFREYELDYFATAYREAALYLNQAGPPLPPCSLMRQ